MFMHLYQKKTLNGIHCDDGVLNSEESTLYKTFNIKGRQMSSFVLLTHC